MFSEFAVTISAGTTHAVPHTEDLELAKGIICYMEVEFPAGCLYTVHFVLERYGHRTWPEPPSVSMCSEDHVIPIRDHFALTEPPYHLKAIGWSPTSQHDHTIRVRVIILPEWIVIPTLKLANALDRFLSFIPGYK